MHLLKTAIPKQNIVNMEKLDISVIVPLYNEEESITELCEWIDRVMVAHGFSYEVICVDDGSTDRSWEIIDQLTTRNKAIKGISFSRNYGKSAALDTGFNYCTGRVVITMDADLQDSPDEIPGLYKMIEEEKYDLVSGWKKKRYDPVSKTIPSKFFNSVTSLISGIDIHDFNCGLKAYRKQVVKSIDVYGDMHRYIPVLAANAGFRNITEKPVQHQARPYGTSKFGTERFVRGFLDLVTLWFVSRFGGRPMHFFGAIGTIMFIIGFLSAIWLGIS